MAAAAELREELLCFICLSTYTDPVMLRCGHSFCRVCIVHVLETQDEAGDYSCPDCREEFQDRPALMRNIALHKIIKKILFTSPTQTETGICSAPCEDLTASTGESSLRCEASPSDKPLRSPSKSAEHILSDPSTSLEEKKCSVHEGVLMFYCTQDAKCICVLCSVVGEHRGHKLESLDEASDKKKKKLRDTLQKLTTKREETEKRVQTLEERWRNDQQNSTGEDKRVTALCTDIRRRVDDLEKKVLREISRQEKEESLSWPALIHQQKIMAELSRKMRHIEELCNMTDPLTVLQEPDTGDLCDPEEDGGDEDTGGHDKPLHGGDDLDVAVISHTLHTLCEVITGIKSGIYVVRPADILLDINTAGLDIDISNDQKTARRAPEKLNHPERAERFQECQVMSRSGFTSGRHYWDVDISRSGDWIVGMCYPSIDRRGLQSYIGNSNKAWTLWKDDNHYSATHDRNPIHLHHQISSNRVRICLDYEAGQLSFYELCDPIRHLHTFTATFSEPLHAVLYLWDGYMKILEGRGDWKKP